MFIPHPVTTCGDVSLPLRYPMPHDVISPLPSPQPIPGPVGNNVETPAFMVNGAGLATFKNKRTSTVFHGHHTIVQALHDDGPLLAHIPTQPDLQVALHTVLSSRKLRFSAGTVTADGKPIGVASPLFLMSVCGDPADLLAAVPAYNLVNDVYVGVQVFDVLIGLSSILSDRIFGHLKRAIKRRLKTNDEPFDLNTYVGNLLIGSLPSNPTIFAADAAAAAVPGLVGLVGREFFGYRGPATFLLSQKHGALMDAGLKLTVTDEGVGAQLRFRSFRGLLGGTVGATSQDSEVRASATRRGAGITIRDDAEGHSVRQNWL